ncbi:hypothetical protein BTO30_14135 [Domibacillus antri]|uniref:HTH cro/C1-type domain-containing protein n=1 Tax=Domibacillus antri TaxID=1714264 RepID=A0A1Q8Q2Q3_9BACI|nr:helix-turn-helix domain-containing protein [Domibacillus antri]OLN21616.1 hypothetical protein BTO30_14135 [Domibacillus antri]
MAINNRIKELRKKIGLTQKQLAEKVNVSPQVISNWERKYTNPDHDDVKKLSQIFDCSTDFLLGLADETDSSNRNALPELSAKDERDIARDLEAMINSLESKNGMASFDGHTVDELDEEDRELLIASLEQSMRLAKRIAKQKYTPKKHRKEQE